MKARAVVFGGAGLLALAATLVALSGRNASEPPADATGARSAALGEQVYREHCASCHGADLEGQPDWQTRRPDGRLPAPPHDETGHTWHHPDEVLFRITKEGIGAVVPGYESDMPAFAGVLSDQEIRAVLAFIKSRWPAEIRARHAEIDAAASRRHPAGR